MAGGIGRRDFITLLGGAAVAWPLPARAQKPGRTYRVAGLSPNPRDVPQYVAVFEELRRLGFIEGQNFNVDGRGYGVRVDQVGEIAVELVKAQVDAILCAGDVAIRAAQRATKDIPILGVAEDMVGSRFVDSLANPGGNTTGVSILSTELNGKRQEILTEAVPGIGHAAALADRNSTTPSNLNALKDAARAHGVKLSIYEVTKPEEIAGAIDAAKSSGVEALNVLASAFLFSNRQIILPRVAALHLPAMYQFPEIAEEGGLIAYGPSLVQIYREIVARQLVKLLQGEKPADIPLEQPIRFQLVVNLKTAKSLGLTIPNSLLLRADEVIE